MPYYTMRDGAALHVRTLGKGAPLVLLHGFAMESRHWLPFAYPLAFRYRVIIPDLRGFGASHELAHNQPCVLTNYADDLYDLLEHLQLEDVSLGGISMGALTALQYFRLYRNARIARYLHIDQAPRGLNNEEWQWGLFGPRHAERIDTARQLLEALSPYEEQQTRYEALPPQLKTQLWYELGRFFASALSRPLHKRAAEKMLQYEPIARRLLRTENWPAYIRCLRAYIEQDYDMRDVLNEIDIPVSLLIGMKSEMYPPAGQLRMADHLSNVRIVPFTGSGHAPLLDQPVKLLHTLFQWAGSEGS